MRRFDAGLIWGKTMNIVGQAGTMQGIYNSISLFFISYFTVFKPELNMPIWLYIVIAATVGLIALMFILRIGISGYYRFFSQQSGLDAVNTQLTEILRRLPDDTIK